jgi:hypothetical protein
MRCLYHPVVRCEAEHVMVRVDQAQRQCALEHHCPAWGVCPVAAYFIEMQEAYRKPGAWEESGGTCV